MTDFVSQGKTRGVNTADLNNLNSHQAYYTALSRSSTAKGTMILQGFDERKITGKKLYGGLRQEFRELELLDEITKLRYNGKLHFSVTGDTRNSLIHTFHKWKGIHHVPATVHSAIRWSKFDPFIESSVDAIDSSVVPLAIDTKTEQSDTHLQQQKQKRKHSTEDSVKKTKRQKRTSAIQLPSPHHCLVPTGMKWSNNSCAYDSVFTLLLSIWTEDQHRWKSFFTSVGNQFLTALHKGFLLHERNQKSLEDTRDNIRHRLQALNPATMSFGDIHPLSMSLQQYLKSTLVPIMYFTLVATIIIILSITATTV
ncbi:hypothetical protein CPB84DRAFT_1678290 [Gymnopilus junonius]|uniref:Uncharacterized protein n=1 Tax=Gymnopilus junonius TaxID=109634 RepID=A0A9P5NRP8_GYMJU|nr:hypothetical protein CPB84DRAFT_1678290 [Gymnopilus junonius]